MDLHFLLAVFLLLLFSPSNSYPHVPSLPVPLPSDTSTNNLLTTEGQSHLNKILAIRPQTVRKSNNIRLGRSLPDAPASNARTNRIINFLERKNIYRKYNLDRALEEWGRLQREAGGGGEEHLLYIFRALAIKASQDIDKQHTEMRLNPNATGNSLILRSLLKFFIEGLSPSAHYKHFPALLQELRLQNIQDKMSLDDAIILLYVYTQRIIDGGLLPALLPANTAPWTAEEVRAENEWLVRTVVKAGNRVYPPNTAAEGVTINDWWLRQLQHSQNVFKIYNAVDALVKGCRKSGLETASIYEALVEEYRLSGRALDAFELNMIDYMAYQMFGMIEHSDPNRW